MSRYQKSLNWLKALAPAGRLFLLLQIFVIGLLVHFVVWTFVSYGIGRDGARIQPLRARKELFVVAAMVAVVWGGYRMRQSKNLLAHPALKRGRILIVIAAVLAALSTFVANHVPLAVYINALRYDYFGYIIFFLVVHLLQIRGRNFDTERLIHRYGKVLKWSLILAVFRWCIIATKSGVLRHIGYQTETIEGVAGEQPPAVYYSEQDHGMPRNQFLFERPISRGFLLTAMWPLFFLLFLQRKRLEDVRGRRLLYALDIFLTGSRAALGAWVIQTVILLLLTYKRIFWKILWYVIVPFLIAIAWFVWRKSDVLLHRSFSTSGHINEIAKGRDMLTQKPLLGRWAGAAGPASHHDGQVPFNTENQFLQILVEFGVVGFIPWMILFCRYMWVGVTARRRLQKLPYKDQKTGAKNPDRLVIAFALGMFGLAITGMVLHSFVDRMIVYPFMALFAVVRYTATKPSTPSL